MSRDDLQRLLVCPACRGGELIGGGDAWACSLCGAEYPVRDGIPILLPPGFDASHVHDEIDHMHEHKHAQAAYFDRGVAEEFEITRPNGAPEAYRWLMGEKFRRSVEHLPALRGATVVDACCGSGMDAEMLARAGARVIAVDISEGCARRARQRARALRSRLPRRRGGRRAPAVARRRRRHRLRARRPAPPRRSDAWACASWRAWRGAALSVNEPADALGTAVMVKLGVSQAWEDAGNRVARLRPEQVARGAVARTGSRSSRGGT